MFFTATTWVCDAAIFFGLGDGSVSVARSLYCRLFPETRTKGEARLTVRR